VEEWKEVAERSLTVAERSLTVAESINDSAGKCEVKLNGLMEDLSIPQRVERAVLTSHNN